MRYLDNDGTPVIVYQSNESRGGIIWGIKQAVEDITISRHVIAQLFWRDFLAQFRQKILGYFWALLNPILSVITFLFLFFIGILRPGEGEIPYPLYVLMGSSIWGCLPGTMASVSGGLHAQSDLIMRTQIPKLALAFSSLAGLLYGIVISMITMYIIFLFMGFTPSWWLLAYPALVLPMVLLGTAAGLVLSVLGSIARDLIPLATQALAFVMYLTPVIYVHSSIQNSIIKLIIEWNPITYLVDIPRSLICLGRAEDIDLFFWVALGTLILFTVGLRIFYLLEDLVAERL